MISKSDECCVWGFCSGRLFFRERRELSFGFSLCREEPFKGKFRSFALGRGSEGDLSLDVTDFVGSSVLRAFGECLGAQRR